MEVDMIHEEYQNAWHSLVFLSKYQIGWALSTQDREKAMKMAFSSYNKSDIARIEQQVNELHIGASEYAFQQYIKECLHGTYLAKVTYINEQGHLDFRITLLPTAEDDPIAKVKAITKGTDYNLSQLCLHWRHPNITGYLTYDIKTRYYN